MSQNHILYTLHAITITLLALLVVAVFTRFESPAVHAPVALQDATEMEMKGTPDETTTKTVSMANIPSSPVSNCDLYIGTSVKGQTIVQEIYNKKDLKNADFREATLASVKFVGSNLSCASFEGATLARPEFIATDLTSAVFTTARITEPSFSNTTCPDGTNSDDNGGTCTL